MISKKLRLAMATSVVVPALALGACAKKDSSANNADPATKAKADTSVSGKIVVSGSSTVEPITALVREDFLAQNSNVDISVDGPGTGDGFKLFCNGETDISDASRQIKDEEAQACADAGVEFIELKIGIDGISVIAPEASPVKCLSFADLYALVGPESEGFTKWTDAEPLAKQLGSNTSFPDANLVITAPGTESGTYDSFVELVTEAVGKTRVKDGKITEDKIGATRADYSASPDDNSIIEGVASDPGGLGWVGFAFADQAEGLKLMPIAKDPDGTCVEPSAATIQDGSYPISRSLYIYVNKAKAEQNKALAAFVDFYLDGLNGFVKAADYIPLEDSSATKSLWTARTVGTQKG